MFYCIICFYCSLDVVYVLPIQLLGCHSFIKRLSCLVIYNPHWSLLANHQLTPVSRSQATPSSTPHLTCETNFLLVFVFLISSILHHHPALLHRHTLILDRLLTFFIAFSTLVLNFFLKAHTFIAIYPFFRAHVLEFDHSVFGSHWRW